MAFHVIFGCHCCLRFFGD